MSHARMHRVGIVSSNTKVFDRFRKSVKRLFTSNSKRVPWQLARLAIEQLEDRQLLAAQYFAAAQPTGSSQPGFRAVPIRRCSRTRSVLSGQR